MSASGDGAAGERPTSPFPIRGEVKHRAVMDAARGLFLSRGYAGTSMDDVAREAAVSKQTVYKHFGDKQRRFTALITEDVARAPSSTHPLVAAMPGTDDVERDLRAFARVHLAEVMEPARLRLRRVLIGEAERFPDLARTWYEEGPMRSARMFAEWFDALGRRGVLHVEDPWLAGQHFNWLVLSIPLNRAMAHPDEHVPDEHLQRYADEAVRVFLAAHRP